MKLVKGPHDVRFGSKADICNAKRHVRFTPESGHVQCSSSCLLWAISGFSLEAAWELRYDYLASLNRSIAKWQHPPPTAFRLSHPAGHMSGSRALPTVPVLRRKRLAHSKSVCTFYRCRMVPERKFTITKASRRLPTCLAV